MRVFHRTYKAFIAPIQERGREGGEEEEEEDLLETEATAATGSVAPAPAMPPLASSSPLARLLLRQFLKFVDRALPSLDFVGERTLYNLYQSWRHATFSKMAGWGPYFKCRLVPFAHCVCSCRGNAMWICLSSHKSQENLHLIVSSP